MERWNDTQLPKVRVVPLQKFTIEGLRRCYHISIMAQGLFCGNDEFKMILTDTKGTNIKHLEDLNEGTYNCYGLHTVNSENELIYIDRFKNIRTLSQDLKPSTTIKNI